MVMSHPPSDVDGRVFLGSKQRFQPHHNRSITDGRSVFSVPLAPLTKVFGQVHNSRLDSPLIYPCSTPKRKEEAARRIEASFIRLLQRLLPPASCGSVVSCTTGRWATWPAPVHMTKKMKVVDTNLSMSADQTLSTNPLWYQAMRGVVGHQDQPQGQVQVAPNLVQFRAMQCPCRLRISMLSTTNAQRRSFRGPRSEPESYASVRPFASPCRSTSGWFVVAHHAPRVAVGIGPLIDHLGLGVR